jgi:hypothetical protein
MSNVKNESLAAKVRNHSISAFDGEDEPEEVIETVLKQEIARLDDQEELSDRAAEKQADLKKDFGIDQ